MFSDATRGLNRKVGRSEGWRAVSRPRGAGREAVRLTSVPTKPGAFAIAGAKRWRLCRGRDRGALRGRRQGRRRALRGPRGSRRRAAHGPDSGEIGFEKHSTASRGPDRSEGRWDLRLRGARRRGRGLVVGGGRRIGVVGVLVVVLRGITSVIGHGMSGSDAPRRRKRVQAGRGRGWNRRGGRREAERVAGEAEGRRNQRRGSGAAEGEAEEAEGVAEKRRGRRNRRRGRRNQRRGRRNRGGG